MKRRIAFGVVLIAVVVLGAAVYASTAPRARASGTTTTSFATTMTLRGQKQGSFTKTPIPVSAVSHEISMPYDTSSGLPSGRRQHKPITVTVQWGPTTPKFLTALTTNENLTAVQINLLQGGVVAATIKLTNAHLVDYLQTDQNAQFTMTYQKIEWTWVSGGVTALDDWQTFAP